VETAIVDGPSMQPTLRTGDRVLILKFLSPERYDIVVLKDPESGGTDIKRIVGLPGETVAIIPTILALGSHEVQIGSQLYIDREPYEEPYADSVMPAALPPVKIPKGSYFAMGDNRDDSTDSRRYGPVPGGSMRGVGVAVIFPLGRMRVLPRGPEAAAPAGTVP
ncbi:MAG TPA: signal peptidase I, partial [Polyangia bacterium]|nr:signal peptidase I [Polyangia bacterium]